MSIQVRTVCTRRPLLLFRDVMRYRLLFRLCVLLALGVLPAHLYSPSAAPRLPAPLCALITGQIICYDEGNSRPITPDGREVVDFAIAPDGTWLAYRAADAVTIAAIYGSTLSQQLDAKATPPA